jgi:hypothetical protein
MLSSCTASVSQHLVISDPGVAYNFVFWYRYSSSYPIGPLTTGYCVLTANLGDAVLYNKTFDQPFQQQSANTQVSMPDIVPGNIAATLSLVVACNPDYIGGGFAWILIDSVSMTYVDPRTTVTKCDAPTPTPTAPDSSETS